jgi:hypothetical protein
MADGIIPGDLAIVSYDDIGFAGAAACLGRFANPRTARALSRRCYSPRATISTITFMSKWSFTLNWSYARHRCGADQSATHVK